MQRDSKISDSDSHLLPLYNELFKAFHDMHDDALKHFTNISSQNKMTLKHEEEILKLFF